MTSKAKAPLTPEPETNGRLPKGWRMARFDEIAQMVNERVDPSETEADIYVGLEHLDSDTLKIRRWGIPSDVIGDKLQFRTGDIIFGRRRAYQRKLAVAEFDGICSAHAMVVRANTEVVDPEFLPFLMQSDLFMQRAIDISVGSLSPTINWKTLRIQEFPLPPKDEQRRAAEILRAADDAIECYRHALTQLELLFKAALNQIVQPLQLPASEWRLITVNELIDEGILSAPQDGNHGELHPTASDYVTAGIPFVMANNVRDRKVDLNTCKFLPKEKTDKLRIGFSLPGDILLTHKGTLGEVAIVPAIECEYIMLTPQVTYYRVLDEAAIDPEFLYFSMMSDRFQKMLQLWSAQSTRAFLGIVAQRQLPLALPSPATQKGAASNARAIEKQIEDLQRHIEALKCAFACLRQTLLGVNA